MKEKIWIALTNDWELRGNGIGNVVDLQYIPALKLMDLYKSLHIPATFTVEVMQQLSFERYADKYASIKSQRDIWIKTVKIMAEKGFDVQLHIHPQWHNASFDGKFWKLDKRWNITDYPPVLIEKFVKKSKKYLQMLVGDKHSIVAFRAGAWGVCCPSSPLFEVLEKYRIKVDVSIVDGVYYDGESIRLDYTQLESPYFPYYPDYNDVRKVSPVPTRIIEIPTQTLSLEKSFRIYNKFCNLMSQVESLLKKNKLDKDAKELPDFIINDPFGFKSGKAYGNYIMDLSANLNIIAFKHGINIIVKRALEKEWPGIVPLVFENHPKDITERKLRTIKKIIQYIQSKYGNIIRFVTLKDIVDHIELINPLIKTNRD